MKRTNSLWFDLAASAERSLAAAKISSILAGVSEVAVVSDSAHTHRQSTIDNRQSVRGHSK